jgi:hypothetical protein
MFDKFRKLFETDSDIKSGLKKLADCANGINPGEIRAKIERLAAPANGINPGEIRAKIENLADQFSVTEQIPAVRQPVRPSANSNYSNSNAAAQPADNDLPDYINIPGVGSLKGLQALAEYYRNNEGVKKTMDRLTMLQSLLKNHYYYQSRGISANSILSVCGFDAVDIEKTLTVFLNPPFASGNIPISNFVNDENSLAKSFFNFYLGVNDSQIQTTEAEKIIKKISLLYKAMLSLTTLFVFPDQHVEVINEACAIWANTPENGTALEDIILSEDLKKNLPGNAGTRFFTE